MKKFLNVLKVIALTGWVLSILMTMQLDVLTVGAGSSIGGAITQETEQFVLAEFGDAKGPVDLANQIGQFSRANFVYDDTVMKPVQLVDTNRFIWDQDFHGVCMDYSAFVKTVFYIVAREKGWTGVACYVAVGHGGAQKVGHAANYITVENEDGSKRVYQFDTTWDQTWYNRGDPIQGMSNSFLLRPWERVEDAVKEQFREYYQYTIIVLR